VERKFFASIDPSTNKGMQKGLEDLVILDLHSFPAEADSTKVNFWSSKEMIKRGIERFSSGPPT